MIASALPGLMLGELDHSHAAQLYRLIQANRDHLTTHGDYARDVATSLDMLAAELADGREPNLRFGIFLDRALIGRMDLIPVDPPRYGLGYWLAKHATGKGHATAALVALVGFARADLCATDIYAGVTHGNAKSAALLLRTGFRPIETFAHYVRFHRVP